jgi:ABC-type lipoprotein release transport system permease subunit
VPAAFYRKALVNSQLYEMKAVSAKVLAVTTGTLIAMACVAGLISAQRAASIDAAVGIDDTFETCY